MRIKIGSYRSKEKTFFNPYISINLFQRFTLRFFMQDQLLYLLSHIPTLNELKFLHLV